MEGVKIGGSSSLGKRPVSRPLFDDDEKKCMCYLRGTIYCNLFDY